MAQSRDAVIAKRYLHAGETSEKQLWKRVADAWGSDDAERKEFEEMMVEGRAIPNTPALANAGREVQMGSACFVLPVPDDTEGILQTLRDATMVHKYGGGTGFDFTPIRSKSDTVASTGRGAPGPVEGPLKGYSEWLGRWSQAGIRPGANMGMLHVDHPDIVDFICAKPDEVSITNFNLSVQLTDRFMRKAIYPGYERALFRMITDGAWENGEPGAFFIDRANAFRLHPETYHATNPCGEVPLLPYEACVLGSVNLAAFVKLRNGRLIFHEPDYRATVKQLTRMLDNIIDAQDYPLPIIEETHKRYRKIGVGVMGFADALYMLDIPYTDDAALHLADDWGRILQEASYEESADLAKTRGVYPGYYSDEMVRFHLSPKNVPARRNLCCQVIAPTGSIARVIPNALPQSTMPVSFGIEPHFDVDENGNFKSFVVGGVYEDHNPFYQDRHFRTTSMVDPLWHVEIQSAWQKHTDQAVSKTVNMPHNVSKDQVAEVYRAAWNLGCKGVTVLRDGAREKVVIDCKGGVCAV